MATKKKSVSKPSVPTAPTVTPEQPKTPLPYEGGGYLDFYRQFTQAQMDQYDNLLRRQIQLRPEATASDIQYAQQWIPAMTQLDIQRQQQLLPVDLQRQQAMMGGAFSEQMREAPIANQFQFGQAELYGPQYTDLFGQLTEQANPEFFDTYNQLAGRIQEGLTAGYQLGPDLQREIDQSIRAGQAARGNYLGPAPTAQEAYGTGEAAVNLYNQRIGAAQNFLQGRQPTDLWSTMGLTMPSMQMPQVQQGYYPNSAGAASLSSQLGAGQNWLQNIGLNPEQASSVFLGYNEMGLQAQSAYNQALISAADTNMSGMFNTYDRKFDQYLLDQSIKHGLYDTPAAPSAAGQQAGSIIQGVGGAAAAASAAAAAFCWLARRCLPDRWREWREWLFTRAPRAFRRKYIYGAKRLAATISDEDAKEIAGWMTKCLQK
jgi:hypothetical protein